MLSLMHFDDIDIAMMTHTTSIPEVKELTVGWTNHAIVAKQIQFIGQGAHAGDAPHQGINALNDAIVGPDSIETGFFAGGRFLKHQLYSHYIRLSTTLALLEIAGNVE